MPHVEINSHRESALLRSRYSKPTAQREPLGLQLSTGRRAKAWGYISNSLLEKLDAVHVHSNYATQVDCQDADRRHLAEQGVETAMYYVHSLYLQKECAHSDGTRRSPLAAKSISKRFRLAIDWQLTSNQIEWVGKAIGQTRRTRTLSKKG